MSTLRNISFSVEERALLVTARWKNGIRKQEKKIIYKEKWKKIKSPNSKKLKKAPNFRASRQLEYFCLWPSAKGQGITRVDVHVLFHLSHFLFKMNLSEKKFFQARVLQHTSRAHYKLSYKDIITHVENYTFILRISKTTTQT